MAIISCSTKFWAFELAQQLERYKMMEGLYTTYSSEKNKILQHFVNRRDREKIPLNKIHTCGILAILMKGSPAKSYNWNILFDKWVAWKIKPESGAVFIGWSGMCLESIRKVKKAGMKVVLERGSSHIEYQSEILTEEYAIHGLKFKSNPSLIDREMQEYSAADFIAVPSNFVKETFLKKGISETKLFVNPYGADIQNKKNRNKATNSQGKFKILYLGTLSFRKGISYLFDALNMINIPADQYEMVFIGKIDEEFRKYCEKHKKPEWKFLGHIDQYLLHDYLETADIGVIPSIEDGFAMVIPQIMAAGVPVITTYNTGAYDMVQQSENGFVVQIRNPQAIANKIEAFYNNPELLTKCKLQASQTVYAGYTWDDYGQRYAEFLKHITA